MLTSPVVRQSAPFDGAHKEEQAASQEAKVFPRLWRMLTDSVVTYDFWHANRAKGLSDPLEWRRLLDVETCYPETIQSLLRIKGTFKSGPQRRRADYPSP